MPLIFIDDQGIHAARQDEILAYLQSVYHGIYGTTIDISTETTDGQFLGILSETWSDIIQVAVQIFNMRGPSSATGAALARLVKINGLTKKDPSPSTGTVTLLGTIGAVIPKGSLIGNSLPGVAATFATTADATLLDDGFGNGTKDVGVASTVNGPIPGNSGNLSVILSVAPGWLFVANALDVTLGNTGETDAQLRVRRTASVALASVGILDGLQAALLQLPGVSQAKVFENPLDTPAALTGGTLAPHAIEAMVIGGVNTDIAQTIWEKRSLGCTMIGGHTELVTDVEGIAHPIKFDIPGAGITLVPIYVKIHSATVLPGGTQTAIRNAIVAWASGLLQKDGRILGIGDVPSGDLFPALQLGDTFFWSRLFLPINTVSGVTVTAVDIDIAPAPTLQADLPMNYNQLATIASATAGANVTFASP